jgi:hypothetical protein
MVFTVMVRKTGEMFEVETQCDGDGQNQRNADPEILLDKSYSGYLYTGAKKEIEAQGEEIFLYTERKNATFAGDELELPDVQQPILPIKLRQQSDVPPSIE